MRDASVGLIDCGASSLSTFPAEWLPVVGLLLGIVLGFVLAAVVLPWGRSS